MPVTFEVAPHPANAVYNQKGHILTAETVFRYGCEAQAERCKEMLQSSVQTSDLATTTPTSSGFVHTVLAAYGSHRHLRIRPDDVWLAILIQLNFYINAHAEELRSLFVAHEGKKRLVVRTVGDRYTVDYGRIAQTFTRRIHENVVDDTLVEWILPGFTTTTTKDITVCSGHPKRYHISIECGIPSVTLEGEKSDWEEIYRRLGRLCDFGKEPAMWAEMLRPILRRFITAFDGEPDTTLWTHVAHRCQYSCGQDDLSGWITAFCVWSNEGKWKGGILPEALQVPAKPRFEQVPPRTKNSVASSGTKRLHKVMPKWLRRHSGSPTPQPREESAVPVVVPENDKSASEGSEGSVMIEGPHGGRGNPTYTLDGIPFFVVSVTAVPPGYCEVDVIVNDNGTELDCMMVAGHVAFTGSSAIGSKTIDTVCPSAHWFIFEKN